MTDPPNAPWREDGILHGIGPHGRRVCLGARQGRTKEISGGYTDQPLRLNQVRINDGGYDVGGAYWGVSKRPLWCAWTNKVQVRIYVRAPTRAAAKDSVQLLLPTARFIR